MRNAAACILAVLLLVPMAAFATVVPDQNTGFLNGLPDSIKSALGTETIRLDIEMNDGSIMTFGIRTENATITGYQEGAYPDSTLAVHVSKAVIEKLSSSKDPVSVVKEEWGNGIRIEGLTFGNQVKFFFLDIGVRLYFFFSGSG